MFTGIIESMAQVVGIQELGTNITFTFSSSNTHAYKIDQSIAHNGVCLTVIAINDNQYKVTAIAETLNKTNLKHLQLNDKVNIERCMPANGRFDGHIVQGHIDQVAQCAAITDQNGSWILAFTYDTNLGNITVDKGSICINGVSLTVVNSTKNGFSVAIIPYTWEHTTFHAIKVGDFVNLEFDIIGKYIQKIMNRG